MTKKILIVDDSPIARMIIKNSFPDDQEFELHEAGDGLEGLEKFKAVNPDITFLDLTMPVMGGVECLQKIMEVDSNAVVLVVTADVQSKSVERVLKLGALCILEKPPSKESIQSVLLMAQKKRG